MIIDDMNLKLTALYTVQEVVLALKDMAPTKVFGNNGFPVLFFQSYWSIVGQDIASFCLKILNEGLIQLILPIFF